MIDYEKLITERPFKYRENLKLQFTTKMTSYHKNKVLSDWSGFEENYNDTTTLSSWSLDFDDFIYL